MHVFLQPPCALVMLTIMRAKMMWASRGVGPGVLESNDSNGRTLSKEIFKRSNNHIKRPTLPWAACSGMVKLCAGRVPRQAELIVDVRGRRLEDPLPHSSRRCFHAERALETVFVTTLEEVKCEFNGLTKPHRYGAHTKTHILDPLMVINEVCNSNFP